MQVGAAPRTRLDRGIPAVGALAVVVHAWWLACVSEDAFISFRFARHLADGLGLVWNPGESPVEGYTNFLWVLLSALGIRLGLDPGGFAQLLGVMAGAAVPVYVYRFGRRLLGLTPPQAAVPLALLAAAGPHAAWSSGGLETSLFSLLTTACLYHALAFAKDGRPGDSWACALAGVLACLTRPEGALVVATAGAALAPSFATRAGRSRPGMALPVGVALAALGGYFTWRWLYFGYPLPNTYYAKTGGGADQLLRGLRHTGEFAACFALPLLPLTAAGWLWRRRSSNEDGSVGGAAAAPTRRHTVRVCAGFVGVWTGYVCAVGGDYMAMFRFFVPALPFLHLLVGSAAAPLFAGPPRSWRIGGVWLAAAIAGTALHSTPVEAKLWPRQSTIHGTWRGVVYERWSVAHLEQMGRFFRAHHRPGDTLGTGQIGAVGYLSEMIVYGFHGLVDPAVAHAPATERMGRAAAGHGRSHWPTLLLREPTFLMLGRPELTGAPREEWPAAALAEVERASPGSAARIVLEYEIVNEFVGDSPDRPAGYFRFLRRKDRPVRARQGSGNS